MRVMRVRMTVPGSTFRTGVPSILAIAAMVAFA
jgi:hypothetical protein